MKTTLGCGVEPTIRAAISKLEPFDVWALSVAQLDCGELRCCQRLEANQQRGDALGEVRAGMLGENHFAMKNWNDAMRSEAVHHRTRQTRPLTAFDQFALRQAAIQFQRREDVCILNQE